MSEIAELAHLKPKQFDEYQKSLLDYWEVKNVKDTAFGEGREKGKIEGRLEEKQKIAKNLLAMALNMDAIVKATGLTADEIKLLQE